MCEGTFAQLSLQSDFQIFLVFTHVRQCGKVNDEMRRNCLECRMVNPSELIH
jgi:hypothetical protein